MRLEAASEAPGALVDGMPEEYIGPLLLELTAHEVGHTLGLRHNFRASAAFSMAEINDPGRKGLPIAASVMDYLPVNFSAREGEAQGEYAMTAIGPYDRWAIEYGYSFEDDLRPILARAAEPGHAYGTDEDSLGPDPLAHKNDLGSDPLEFARRQMEIVKLHRQRLLEKFVKSGESWAKARRGYEATLVLQLRALSTMTRWIGGLHVHRDRKGDQGGRAPLEPVPPAAQRDALRFVMKAAFDDDAFGLTPDLLRHLGADQWLEDLLQGLPEASAWPVHSKVLGVQSAVLTLLLNPATLGRVFDNEARSAGSAAPITVPEVLRNVADQVWSELAGAPRPEVDASRPWISNLRRNLQSEHLARVIDLARADAHRAFAAVPIASLALEQLRELRGRIGPALESCPAADSYSLAHLRSAWFRIQRVLEPDGRAAATSVKEASL